MSNTKFTATLVIHVTYELDPKTAKDGICQDLVNNLRQIPRYLAGEGLLSGCLPAEVDTYSANVMAHMPE
jgi:hypothetical protein